jgi:ABC-2 type transport system ATP-binding protein
MAILEAKNLSKRFGEFLAVDNLSLTLKEGEILGLLGPNGAGKTTTIQILLGVMTPTEGEILYFGKNLKTHRSEILEHVSFSSTYTNLPWDLTVEECLTYTSFFYEILERKKRVGEIVKLFHLEPLFKQRVSELSAGQTTRVNLAKAFLNSPRVLLLDEPTASLDPDVADYIRKFLLEDRQKFKTSIIFTSHNMAEVEQVCDRVVFINHGKIVADDTPENLAKTVKTSHMELYSLKDTQRITSLCRSFGLNFRSEGKRIFIDIQESKIAEILNDFSKQGIAYEEISIQKPTLEDYFLLEAKERSVNESK